jgi:hypothetical protein
MLINVPPSRRDMMGLRGGCAHRVRSLCHDITLPAHQSRWQHRSDQIPADLIAWDSGSLTFRGDIILIGLEQPRVDTTDCIVATVGDLARNAGEADLNPSARGRSTTTAGPTPTHSLLPGSSGHRRSQQRWVARFTDQRGCRAAHGTGNGERHGATVTFRRVTRPLRTFVHKDDLWRPSTGRQGRKRLSILVPPLHLGSDKQRDLYGHRRWAGARGRPGAWGQGQAGEGEMEGGGGGGGSGAESGRRNYRGLCRMAGSVIVEGFGTRASGGVGGGGTWEQGEGGHELGPRCHGAFAERYGGRRSRWPSRSG